MKSLRRIELWAALVVFALLAALSVIGALRGADKAGLMFTSVPLAVFWVFFVVLILAGIFTFPRLLRTPALVVAHLGFVLVVAGAFWGSHTGNRLEGALTGKPKVHDGYMGLQEGQASNIVTAGDKQNTPVGSLPFSIRLDDFTVDYYPADESWRLIAQVPTPPEHGGQEAAPYIQVRVPYQVGKPVDVGHTSAKLTVLQYLPHARAVNTSPSEGKVEVTTPDGTVSELPAAVGATLTLEKPKVTVRVVKVFGTLRVMGMGKGEEMEVVDVPGPPQNPAVKLEVEHADGTKTPSYAYARMRMHGQAEDQLRFDFSLPVSAEPDPDGLPAVEFRIDRGARHLTGWVIGSSDTRKTEDGAHYSVTPVGDILTSDAAPAGQIADTALFLVEPLGDVKDYKSTLSVMEEGKAVLTRTIEVNRPLSYGGYRFYQYNWDQRDLTFSELSVNSSSGVWLIYLGFICLGGSVFWWMWVQPILRHAARRGEAADGRA